MAREPIRGLWYKGQRCFFKQDHVAVLGRAAAMALHYLHEVSECISTIESGEIDRRLWSARYIKVHWGQVASDMTTDEIDAGMSELVSEKLVKVKKDWVAMVGFKEFQESAQKQKTRTRVSKHRETKKKKQANVTPERYNVTPECDNVTSKSYPVTQREIRERERERGEGSAPGDLTEENAPSKGHGMSANKPDDGFTNPPMGQLAEKIRSAVLKHWPKLSDNTTRHIAAQLASLFPDSDYELLIEEAAKKDRMNNPGYDVQEPMLGRYLYSWFERDKRDRVREKQRSSGQLKPTLPELKYDC